MAKFYVQSGPVRLLFDASDKRHAAVKAFQWTCDRQATIDADCPLEHLKMAEQRGWQLHEEVAVSEVGFDRADADRFDTLLVVAAWQECLERDGSPLASE